MSKAGCDGVFCAVVAAVAEDVGGGEEGGSVFSQQTERSHASSLETWDSWRAGRGSDMVVIDCVTCVVC